ncbi:hypothetical protein PQ455_01120 [Sphingomonas naphthae]|uniref:Uncharacterized protein n=1 Tax=Sphingomonas naphthae TaxID=1813468 RepID=A0ABY7TL23_9SPHN|nr:hypothetical protein [Sphingomonas naphthae]WCT73864.1 hypothetical protein PQ455_01120 [Sphingomonas naphthae]
MRARVKETILWAGVAAGLILVATKLGDVHHADRWRVQQSTAPGAPTSA